MGYKAATVSEAPVKQMVNTATYPTDLSLLQSGATPEEKANWKQKVGALGSDRIWRNQTTNLPFLPKSAFSGLAKVAHGLGHASWDAMVQLV